VFERFTVRAREVVVLAQDEARRLRHDYIGTEHILLGLLREEEGVAARILETHRVDLDRVRNHVAQIIGHGDGLEEGQVPLTPRAKTVLELALQDAVRLGHSYVGTEHILIGLLHEGGGVAVNVLRDVGADPDVVWAAVHREVGVAEPPPRPRGASRIGLHAAFGSEEIAVADKWAWLYGTGAAIGIGAAVFGSGLFIGWLIWG
jgi:ATP-dependent Clp protease ATP-binding subunit ClpC